MNSNTFYRILLGLLATVLLISCGSKEVNTPENKQPLPENKQPVPENKQLFPEKGAIYLFSVPAEDQSKTNTSAEGICFSGDGEAEHIVLRQAPDDRTGTYVPCKVSYDPAQKVLTKIIPDLGAVEGTPKELKIQYKYDEVNDLLRLITNDPADDRVVWKRSSLKRSDLTLTDRREL